MKILLSMNSEGVFAPIWLRSYIERGHEIDLISTYTLKSNPWLNFEWLSEERTSTKLRELNVRFRLIGNKMGDYLKMGVALAAITRKIEYDALHVHSLEIRGILSAFGKTKKLILTPYGSDIFGTKRWGLAGIFDTVTDILIKKTLDRADLVLPTSQYMEYYLNRKFGVEKERMFMRSWGIDTDYWNNPTPPSNDTVLNIEAFDEVVFLSYRSSRPRYRIHLLPDIHRNLLDSGLNCHFIYVLRSCHPAQYAKDVKNKIKRLGLLDRSTIIENELQIGDLKHLLSISDYFFSIPEWDQIGSTVMEGMYCKSVPIVSAIPAYTEVLEDDTAVIMSGNVDDMVKKILSVAEMGMHEDRKVLETNRNVIERNHNRKMNMTSIIQKIEDVLSN